MEILADRLISQHLTEIRIDRVKEIAGWMCAIQAQDYAMAKWAIGVRLPGSTIHKVEEAISKAEIIRTHLMRPTWHIVSADDVYWMLELTAPQIRSILKSRHQRLGLTDEIIKKSIDTIAKALEGRKQLTRDELMTELARSKIKAASIAGAHILLHAEINGVVCSGADKGKNTTYALLEERVPQQAPISRDEALGKLAGRYFTSRGPAILQDFIWWSGLSVSDAKRALEIVKVHLVAKKDGETTYWFPDTLVSESHDYHQVHLLPAYDEYIISYKDRSGALSLKHNKKAIANNGMFYPVVLINGIVCGIWKRSVKNETVTVEIQLFQKISKSSHHKIENAAHAFGNFLQKKTEIIISNSFL